MKNPAHEGPDLVVAAAATVYIEFHFLSARNLKKCELLHSALELGCLLKGEILRVNIDVPLVLVLPHLTQLQAIIVHN